MKKAKLAKWVGRDKPAGTRPIEVRLLGDIANSPAHAAAMDGTRLWLDLHFMQAIDPSDPAAVGRLVLAERESLRQRIRDAVEVSVLDALPEFQEYRRVGREYDAADREAKRLAAKLKELGFRRQAEELSPEPSLAKRLQAVDREVAAAQAACDQAAAEVATLQPLLAPRKRAVEAKLQAIREHAAGEERADLERKEQCLLERLFGESGELLDELASTRLALRDVLTSGPSVPIDLDKIDVPAADQDEDAAPLFPDGEPEPVPSVGGVPADAGLTPLVRPVVGQPTPSGSAAG